MKKTEALKAIEVHAEEWETLVKQVLPEQQVTLELQDLLAPKELWEIRELLVLLVPLDPRGAAQQDLLGLLASALLALPALLVLQDLPASPDLLALPVLLAAQD